LSALQKLKFSVAQNHNSNVHRTRRSGINNDQLADDAY
jgi:hypothetical protein